MKKNKKIFQNKKQKITIIFLIIFFIFEVIYNVVNIINKKTIYENTILRFQQVERKFNSNDQSDNEQIKTYYISSDGVSKDGTNINEPMSLEEANNKTFYGNEKVLFKRGDIFYGTINFKVNASEKEMFYIGAYGIGEKPILSGANILINKNAWNYENDNIYKLDLSKYSDFEGLGQTYWDPYNIGFFEDENGRIYGERKKEKSLLEKENDFYCEDNFLYLKSYGNPSERLGRIKFVTRWCLVNLSSNTILADINIQDTGVHGIQKKGNNIKNVYIHDCIIQNVGGSVQDNKSFTRYGNGIEFWNQAENTLIEKCIIRNTYDAGYTTQGDSVTDGFINNIFRNNILMNCTYDIEMFSYNINNKVDVKLEKQVLNNNLSINQGRGWGYDVRNNEEVSSILVLWDSNLLPKDSDITLNNNKYINSRNLFYTYKPNPIPVKQYSKAVHSDNNTIYLNKETTLFVGNGNYQDRSILKEYNQDQNSTFKLLTDAQVQQISNPEILNSNDYNEIKIYYEELEKEFEYTELKQEIIEKYNNFLVSNETLLSPIKNINNNINSIIGRIEDMTLDTTNEASLKEIINIVYSVESNIIGANVNKNITITEMIKLINELNELAKNMDIIYSKVEISNAYNKNEIAENIQESQNYINSNKDLEIDNLVELSKIGNEISNKETTTYADYLYAITLSNWTDNILNTKIKDYIAQNPVTIEYSETNITNKSVKTTIKTNAEIQITNNSNSKEYVFNQNGSFTFEYTIKGQAKQITAKVTNIDKTSPIINGVIDGKLYTSKITPTIKDENIDTIKLILNGEEVKNFKSGTTLTEEGFYTLTAIDKAGNKTQISFQIMESNNQNYIVQENIIKNISEQTKKSDFDNKLKLGITYKITRNEKEIASTDNVATGDILTTSAGDKYTLIVAGDINKDGKVDLKDLIKIRKSILDDSNLEANETLAADCNSDGKINLKDLVKVRLMILKKDATK